MAYSIKMGRGVVNRGRRRQGPKLGRVIVNRGRRSFGSNDYEAPENGTCPDGMRIVYRGDYADVPFCAPIPVDHAGPYESTTPPPDTSTPPVNVIGGLVDWVTGIGKSVVATVSPKTTTSSSGLSTGAKVAIVGAIGLYFLIGRK